MWWLASIAEEKIQDSIRRGDFDHLAGKGLPLPPEGMEGVPEELRLSFKMLKNAGVLPEEMQLRKEMLTLEDLLAACRDESARVKLRSELSVKKLRYQSLMSERGWHGSAVFTEYEGQIRDKLAGK